MHDLGEGGVQYIILVLQINDVLIFYMNLLVP